MIQRFKDAWLFVRLNRVCELEYRRDYLGALEAALKISYSGRFVALLGTYIARLMTLSRDGRALEYVRSMRRLIREYEADLEYWRYCLAYRDYLECALSNQPYKRAGQEVLLHPSTGFVRGILPVT